MEQSKSNETLRSELDGFKHQQESVNEKITEMIQMETDAREQAEDEKKSVIQNMLRGITDEVATMKDEMDAEMIKLNKEVKEIANDNSERAHFLSRYVDDEILKVSKKAAKQIENIKLLSAKLTEQFKKHLINHENMKQDIYKRFEFIEKHLPIYRSELYKLMERSEERMLQKMKEVKEIVDSTMLTNFRSVDERMD